MNFNEKLLTLRKNAGMSQDALAEKLGVTRQAVSKWEQGTAMPETKSIVQIAQVFSVTTDYLLGYTAVQYPDIKQKMKNNKEKITFAGYIIVTMAFLFCCMKTVVHLAREITLTVRPLAYISVEEWKEIAWSLGLDNLQYSVLFAVVAVILYIVKMLIRKSNKGTKI
ncbi:MAG: helix-turn-helix transcriptional regulator [Oscillospiraceae bacterium]|nr:helix-turn-helix transcriptional regulator [Oscillospiraceae bacterium]